MRERNESSPLLHHSQDIPISDSGQLSFFQETLSLLRSTVPIAASFALQNVVQAVSVVIAGSLGHQELNITSYGFMFASCTGSMVAIGGATALDTLCGHALAAAAKTNQQYTVMGRHLQQTLLILSLLFAFIITPIWILSNRLFLMLGQEAWLALGTHQFLVAMLPAGYAQLLAECLRKYAQVQGQSAAVSVVTLVAAIIGVVTNIIFVQVTDLGVRGGPFAFLIYQLTIIVILVVWLLRKERERKTISCIRTWNELIDGLAGNAFLALTGLATIATEWWCFEIVAMMAARLSAPEIAAQSILMSADLILTTVSLGTGVAASHRIGHFLGRNEPVSAKRAALPPYLLSLSLSLVELILLLTVKSKLGHLFTADPATISTTAKVLPVMACFQILDISNGGAGGILRGAKRNHLSGLCNFFAYYGIGLTAAWVLCFRAHWGILGLWAGIVCASGALIIMQSFCVLNLPWKTIALEASGETVPDSQD